MSVLGTPYRYPLIDEKKVGSQAAKFDLIPLHKVSQNLHDLGVMNHYADYLISHRFLNTSQFFA